MTEAAAARHYIVHDHLAGQTLQGPFDDYRREQVLEMVPKLPGWPSRPHLQKRQVEGAGWLLDWLSSHPGEGWRDRWVAADMNHHPTDWVVAARATDHRTAAVVQAIASSSLRGLVVGKVLLPGYSFFTYARTSTGYAEILARQDPDLMARMRDGARTARLPALGEQRALVVLAKILLHTGRGLELLAVEDLFEYRACVMLEGEVSATGVRGAWDLLAAAGVLPSDSAMRTALRPGQRSPAELVDRYQLRCRPVRDLLVRYLEERKTAIDYATLKGLAAVLADRFWRDLERHHPDLETIQLSGETVTAWKERLSVVTAADGSTRPRDGFLGILLTVRCFYLDLRDWAMTDPSLVEWAVPSPISAADVAGSAKRKQRSKAKIHQRIRERLPMLPTLVGKLEDQLEHATQVLESAKATALGESFQLSGHTYTRVLGTFRRGSQPDGYGLRVADTGHGFSAALVEDEAFWTWAMVETLRHTGLRIEELLELTHLALVSYQLPSTGEMVPLLQVVPSKTNEERLLLVAPELASVLATIISRIRGRNDGSIPLVARYDNYEAVTGPRLPHLFQREYGAGPTVLGPSLARQMLNRAVDKMGFTDQAGAPLHFTPHDFRRMFATDAVRNGLPLHIASRLLGHRHLNSAEVYVAVFDDDLIRTYRSYVDRRRATRPAEEYRQPTEAEWEEFEEHFQLRKVELGSCARPYGSNCSHEHACIRCPMLRVDSRQLQRLEHIATNLELRIAEAREHGWAGEEQQLQISLTAARTKIAAATPAIAGPVLLPVPVIRNPTAAAVVTADRAATVRRGGGSRP